MARPARAIRRAGKQKNYIGIGLCELEKTCPPKNRAGRFGFRAGLGTKLRDSFCRPSYFFGCLAITSLAILSYVAWGMIFF